MNTFEIDKARDAGADLFDVLSHVMTPTEVVDLVLSMHANGIPLDPPF